MRLSNTWYGASATAACTFWETEHDARGVGQGHEAELLISSAKPSCGRHVIVVFFMTPCHTGLAAMVQGLDGVVELLMLSKTLHLGLRIPCNLYTCIDIIRTYINSISIFDCELMAWLGILLCLHWSFKFSGYILGFKK